MHLSWRDWLATFFVGVALVAYLMSSATTGVFDSSRTDVVAAVVFACGLAASVTAVVYGVGAGLLRANKPYLAITALLGVVALVAGIIAMATESEAALTALTAATVLLWLASTVRHAMTPAEASDTRPRNEPQPGHA